MESSGLRGRSGRIVALALKKIKESDEQQDSYDSDSNEIISDSDSDYLPSDVELYRNFFLESESPTTSPQQLVVEENQNWTNPKEAPEKKTHKPKRIRRKHVCIYCNDYVGNFVRHLERNHSDELEVQKFMSLNKKSRIRTKFIDKIRREGDFCSTNIIAVKQVQDIDISEYLPCKFCRGYYARKSLRRHAKKCYFNPNPTHRFNAQTEGQNVMTGHFGPNDVLKTTGLLTMMRADNISLVAKKDIIICEVARRYIRSHKEKHLLSVAKRNMRRLARLLINARTIEQKNFALIDLLHPSKFKLLIKATKNVAEYDENERIFKSASLALQMGTLIKHAINTAYSLLVQTENASADRLRHLQELRKLIETDWANEISSEACQNLNMNKFNRTTLIPAAEDIKKFEDYLKNLIVNMKINLVKNSKDAKSYRSLIDGIFCNVMLFNRRRVGELQRMTLSSYVQSHISNGSDFEKALTESEKILYKSLRRAVVRGKRGRPVPVLFEKYISESIDFAINVRSNFNLDENIYLFGLPGTKNPIPGNVVMRKHAKLALGDMNKACLLTSTKLRKHLATIVQILNMEKNELEQLATFLGHTEKTHAEFYRLPADIYQTAKVSKILLLSKRDGIEHFKGKNLQDLNIDDGILENDNDESESEEIDIDISDTNEGNRVVALEKDTLDANNADDQNTPVEKSLEFKKGPKRILVPWTQQQKKLAEDYFKNHIKKRIPPKKDEIITLTSSHPGVFDNKTWKVIKVFITNKFRKK